MTAAIEAQGTLLKAGNGASPEVFTTIAEVNDIRWNGLATTQIEVTNHGSTGGFREYILTNQDGGEVVFDVNYVPGATTHKNAAGGFLKRWVDKTTDNYTVTWPSSPVVTWSFAAIITNMDFSAPARDAALSGTVTLKVTGQPTLV
ncbi:MAG TPA: phage tail tube protein [Propylenella sp.]